MLKRFRASVEKRPWLNLVYKITVSTIGGAVILAGIAMLVLPGPGWLTIFLGLGILGTEFEWARRILRWLRMKVATWAGRWKAYRAAKKREATHAGGVQVDVRAQVVGERVVGEQVRARTAFAAEPRL